MGERGLTVYVIDCGINTEEIRRYVLTDQIGDGWLRCGELTYAINGDGAQGREKYSIRRRATCIVFREAGEGAWSVTKGTDEGVAV